MMLTFTCMVLWLPFKTESEQALGIAAFGDDEGDTWIVKSHEGL